MSYVQFTWALRSSLQQSAEPEYDSPLVLLHHLEADAEGEGEGGDDDEPGDAGEDPTAHPDSIVRVVRCNIT